MGQYSAIILAADTCKNLKILLDGFWRVFSEILTHGKTIFVFKETPRRFRQPDTLFLP
jgi:hypothetical protein